MSEWGHMRMEFWACSHLICTLGSLMGSAAALSAALGQENKKAGSESRSSPRPASRPAMPWLELFLVLLPSAAQALWSSHVQCAPLQPWDCSSSFVLLPSKRNHVVFTSAVRAYPAFRVVTPARGAARRARQHDRRAERVHLRVEGLCAPAVALRVIRQPVLQPICSLSDVQLLLC